MRDRWCFDLQMALHVGGRRRNSGSEESTVDDGGSSNDEDHREAAKAEVRENDLPPRYMHLYIHFRSNLHDR